jgi:hypothetical protein
MRRHSNPQAFPDAACLVPLHRNSAKNQQKKRAKFFRDKNHDLEFCVPIFLSTILGTQLLENSKLT